MSAAAGEDTLVRVEDLRVHFPITSGVVFQRRVGAVHAVDGLTFDVRRGETLGLVGESGCGKSTTGRAILQLIRPTTGRVMYEGGDLANLRGNRLREQRKRMQMIFQDPYASLNSRMTIGDIIGEPLLVHKMGSKKERKARVRELLETVGINPNTLNRYPHEFSGGQRQRIGIARALAVEPNFIVCDEPISALDVSIRAQIINLLQQLQREFGLTYLFIAHDLSVVRHISDRVAVMYLGRVVELAENAVLYERPMHPYTQALLSAVPIPDPEAEERRRPVVLTGDVPSPVEPPSGCHFHTRCPAAREGLCDVDDPPLLEVRPGHWAACHLISGSDYPHIRAGEDDLAVVAEGGEPGMSYVPPEGPGSSKIIRGLEPETEIDLGLGSAASGASEIGTAVGAAGMWSPDALLIEHRSLWSEIWRRFRRDKFAMIGVVIIILLVLVAVLAPWIAPHDPTRQYDEGLTMDGMPVGSSAQFPLGTDTLGRDLLSRLMYGARVSLVVGVLANGFALILGVIFGLTAGYFRGGVETLLMRMTDVMMAFPIILLAVALVSVLKPSIWILVLVIGIVYWTPMTRVIHGEVLSIREKEFVEAARLTGCTNRRILSRHILPHLMAVILVYTSLGLATTILFEATLSYIGLGIQPPTPSWGQMISEGQPYYLSAPHLVIYPGLAIMITVLAFNLVGDGLRDAFDPQQRRR